MKTLTLFRAYVKASDGFWTTECNLATNVIDEDVGVELANKRIRQSEKLEEALTERLQEQEERDKKIEELVLAYNQLEEKGSALKSRWMANEGEDLFDWGIIETMNKYQGETFKFCDVCIEVIGTLKEKTDAELIQSNSPQTNEEGALGGSQDSQ